MADVKNLTMFGSVEYNTSIANPFNYSSFANQSKDLIDLKTHFITKNEPIILIKKSTFKKRHTQQKASKSQKGNSREVRKKEHGHRHGTGHGHEHGGGHEHGHAHGNKGCVVKYIKGDKDDKEDEKKKFLLPMMIGLVTAKAILLPLVLKSLAILSAKGLMLGLVAIVMASVLGLRKMMEPSFKIEGKKDDVTKIEVVQIPIREKVHHNHHYPKHYVDITEESSDSSHHPYQGYY